MNKPVILLIPFLFFVNDLQKLHATLGVEESHEVSVSSMLLLSKFSGLLQKKDIINMVPNLAKNANHVEFRKKITTSWFSSVSGRLTFKIKFDQNTNEKISITLFYIIFDEKTSKFERFPVEISRKEVTPSDPIINNLSFHIPTEINSKIVKFQISLSGNARAVLYDLSVPGVFEIDPTRHCAPDTVIPDMDGDGIIDADDDFPTDASRAFRYFLTNKNFSTLMFEDLWPAKGDYDFNDLVNDLRVSVVSNSKNQVVELIIESRTRAIGAAFRNGLGLELTGITPDLVTAVNGHIIDKESIHKMAYNQVEAGQEFATIILFDDANAVLKRVSGGTGINVEPNRPLSEVQTQVITVSFEVGKITSKELTFEILNPFLIVNQIRGREIHLAGKQPTKLADAAIFGTGSDASRLGSKQMYLSKEGNLPWAIWVNKSIPYMQERVGITEGFEKLKDWANSRGKKFSDWYVDRPGHINREWVFKNQ